MRRILLFALLGVLICPGSLFSHAYAQETNLESGVYADQLTGFSVAWDPAVFTGSQSTPGVLQLDGVGSGGTLTMTSASTARECLERVQTADPLGQPDQDGETPATPTATQGSATELGFKDGKMFRACLADPVNPASTLFILLTISGPGPKAEWDAEMAAWQPVINSIKYPDPALMTSTGITGNRYIDPLYGWSVLFDPVRYEAQYATGTANSTYLSGLFLYSELDGESSGIWAERHENVEDCLEAQRSVNSDLTGFAAVPEGYGFSPDSDVITGSTWEFQIDPDAAYFVFAGCQQLLDNASPVEGVYLVTTFTVPESAFFEASAAWSAMLKTLTFRGETPNGTPIT